MLRQILYVTGLKTTGKIVVINIFSKNKFQLYKAVQPCLCAHSKGNSFKKQKCVLRMKTALEVELNTLFQLEFFNQ